MRCSPPAPCTTTCAAGLRCDVNLIVETGTARDPHHIACLLGFGATAVYPYLAYQTLFDLGRRGILQQEGRRAGADRPQLPQGHLQGPVKIISKMGICTIASYRGAQLFEIVGLDRTWSTLCFDGTPSRVGGAGFARLDPKPRRCRARLERPRSPEQGGLLKYVHGGEYHMYNPDVVP
jgi:glutamate synthase (NADPH/NADH) large chain